MDRRELLMKYNGNLSELRNIMKSFQLIPNAPIDEFDKLNHKILSHLDSGANEKKIGNILQSELIVTYGLYSTEFDETIIADAIVKWWNSN